MTNFDSQYSYGKVTESAIAKWLAKKGYAILPAYEIIDDKKGPRLFLLNKKLVIPDILAIKPSYILWVEAKHKNAFTWHRITNKWTTGIDLKHYEDYIQVTKITNLPIWLLFLHDGKQAKDSPPNSPAGLFGNALDILIKTENHRHSNWGLSGMVYWARECDGGGLKEIVSYEEFNNFI